MITALDTNILLDILVSNEDCFMASAKCASGFGDGRFFGDQRYCLREALHLLRHP